MGEEDDAADVLGAGVAGTGEGDEDVWLELETEAAGFGFGTVAFGKVRIVFVAADVVVEVTSLEKQVSGSAHRFELYGRADLNSAYHCCILSFPIALSSSECFRDGLTAIVCSPCSHNSNLDGGCATIFNKNTPNPLIAEGTFHTSGGGNGRDQRGRSCRCWRRRRCWGTYV